MVSYTPYMYILLFTAHSSTAVTTNRFDDLWANNRFDDLWVSYIYTLTVFTLPLYVFRRRRKNVLALSYDIPKQAILLLCMYSGIKYPYDTICLVLYTRTYSVRSNRSFSYCTIDVHTYSLHPSYHTLNVLHTQPPGGLIHSLPEIDQRERIDRVLLVVSGIRVLLEWKYCCTWTGISSYVHIMYFVLRTSK